MINVVKLEVGNKNFDSMLPNVVSINVQTGNVDSILIDTVNVNVDIRCFNVNLILPDFVTSYHPNNNADTTLKYLLSIEECC